MTRLKIEKPTKDKNEPSHNPSRGALALLLIVLLLSVAAAAVYFFWAKPVPGPDTELEVTSFSGDIQVWDSSTGAWSPVDRGRKLKIGDKLKAGSEAEADLEVEDKIRVRVKQNSEFGFLGPKMYEKNPYIRMKLDRGEMLVATQKGFGSDRLDVETPHFTAQSQGGYFRARTTEDAKNSWLGLMRGKAKIHSNELIGSKSFEIQGLEVAEAGSATGPLAQPRRVNKDEWQELSEVYQLTVKSAALEAEQLDLSKQAGTFFNYVFDHGTFYTPDFGYALRDFFKDESSGQVYLETEYDVFPKGSFVGMYIKTRDLDLSQYSHLEFEMKQVPDEGYPQAIRIEVKSKNGVVRAFAAKMPRQNWEKVSFPLHVRESILATEVAFVFLHDRVGEYKKGSVQFRNVNLIRAPKLPEPVKTAADTAAVSPKTAPALPVSAKTEIPGVPVPAPAEPGVTKEEAASPEPAPSVWAKPVTL